MGFFSNETESSKQNWDVSFHVVYLLYKITSYATSIFQIHLVKESLQKREQGLPDKRYNPPYPNKQSRVGLMMMTRVGHSPAGQAGQDREPVQQGRVRAGKCKAQPELQHCSDRDQGCKSLSRQGEAHSSSRYFFVFLAV